MTERARVIAANCAAGEFGLMPLGVPNGSAFVDAPLVRRSIGLLYMLGAMPSPPGLIPIPPGLICCCGDASDIDACRVN